ncbi:hotdog fold thioesterase [Paenibacillus camelliae]|nr:hotdog fold thioesterase [Paenibacillus camelliae]MCM3635606.1 hotdog fold thioesterase [Paenibacillus camelliae]
MNMMDTTGTIIEALQIETVLLTPEKVICTMPVNERTRQPFGFLHGGASLVLAETVASIGAWASIDQENEVAMGMEINANHVRSVREGIVTAVGVPLHKGRKSAVWDIKITDEQDRLLCVSRCTVAISPKRP